jgi:hypothetical protein
MHTHTHTLADKYDNEQLVMHALVAGPKDIRSLSLRSHPLFFLKGKKKSTRMCLEKKNGQMMGRTKKKHGHNCLMILYIYNRMQLI